VVTNSCAPPSAHEAAGVLSAFPRALSVLEGTDAIKPEPHFNGDFHQGRAAAGRKAGCCERGYQRPAEEKFNQKPAGEKVSQKPAEAKPDRPAEEKKDSPVSQGLASSTDEKASDQQPLALPALRPVLPTENAKKKGRETDRGPPGHDPLSATYLLAKGAGAPASPEVRHASASGYKQRCNQ
jgi:hypothetical protein